MSIVKLMHLDAVLGASEDLFRRTYLYVEKEPQRSNNAMRQMHKLYKYGVARLRHWFFEIACKPSRINS